MLVVVLHVAFLDHLAGWTPLSREATAAALSVRTIAPDPAAPVEAPAPVATAIDTLQRPPSTRAALDRSPLSLPAQLAAGSAKASAGSRPEHAAGSGASESRIVTAADPDVADGSASAASAAAATAESTPETLAAAPRMDLGGPPPPVYATRLPPPATIHYQVRRGVLRGAGAIRWQPAGDTYRLVLEATVAGLTLLVQTSEGGIDGNGLAPVRFLDQRARRAAQAANFVRDGGRITFSGKTAEWPLVAGSQDRLSWMIQLAGIVAADPALLRDGARITIAVVGARGDAAIWSLRYVGRETVETANGSVSAEKLVRDGRSANDTTAEIWLDPEHAYLPAHATLRNASGASEYDLLLDRVEP